MLKPEDRNQAEVDRVRQPEPEEEEHPATVGSGARRRPAGGLSDAGVTSKERTAGGRGTVVVMTDVAHDPAPA